MFFPGIDCNQLPEVVLSPPVYCTHWVEKVFVGDHGDAPKVRKGKKRPLSARSYITFIREGIPKISIFLGSLPLHPMYPILESSHIFRTATPYNWQLRRAWQKCAKTEKSDKLG